MRSVSHTGILLALGIAGVSVAGISQVLPQPAHTPQVVHHEEAQMAGKEKTDRSIIMKFVVDANHHEVFRLWSTEEGTRRFFGTDAHIELRVGGSYEIYFLPRDNPQCDANSTKGARLLTIEPGKELAFEWTAPPFASQFNTQPLPTWVEVRLEPLEGDSGRTVVLMAHHGFQRGHDWDRVYEFFVRSWASVLYRLDLVCSGVEPERPFLNLS